MIEHADFLDHAKRRIERQQIDQRAELHPLGRRATAPMNTPGTGTMLSGVGVMLGEMQAIEAGRVGRWMNLSRSSNSCASGPLAVLDMIEKSDFHNASFGLTLSIPASAPGIVVCYLSLRFRADARPTGGFVLISPIRRPMPAQSSSVFSPAARMPKAGKLVVAVFGVAGDADRADHLAIVVADHACRRLLEKSARRSPRSDSA